MTYTINNARYKLGYDGPPVRIARAAPTTTATKPGLAAFVEATAALTLEPWQRVVCARLAKLRHQTGQRLLIHGPPQYGKSIIISQRFPAWYLGYDPLARIRLACYNLTHAERFSKVNLMLMQSPDYQQAFPDSRTRVPIRASSEEWSTAARADKMDANPSFKPLGIGSGFTGLGVDTLIVDDPYKNQQEALSTAVNENIWSWWANTVTPRMNVDTNVVVMFHRWHDRDLAGRLMELGGWELMRFAAIADSPDDIMGRELGELLSPRYPREYLDQVKRTQGSSFYALYQGTPREPEGDFFKRQWFNLIDVLPVTGMTWVRYWDLATGISQSADYTAGVLMGRTPDGRFVVADVQHGRWAPSERNARIKQQAALDTQQYGKVRTVIEQAPGLGREPTDDLIRQLAGYPVYADKVSADKMSRAEPFQAQAQAGNVDVLIADWTAAYLDELTEFPTGAHDDRVDGSSGGLNHLALLPTSDHRPARSHSQRTWT